MCVEAQACLHCVRLHLLLFERHLKVFTPNSVSSNYSQRFFFFFKSQLSRAVIALSLFWRRDMHLIAQISQELLADLQEKNAKYLKYPLRQEASVCVAE